MRKKLIIIIALTVGSFTNAFAGAGHSQGHDHDSEGSPVGQPAPSAQSSKIIKVTALDTMRYKFSPQVELKEGEIVTFVVTNKGKITHEFSIGDAKEQKAHQQMMRKMPNMTHQDGNSITLKPGETKEITWKFKKGPNVVFACNIPGHFEAGMFLNASVEGEHAHHDH